VIEAKEAVAERVPVLVARVEVVGRVPGLEVVA